MTKDGREWGEHELATARSRSIFWPVFFAIIAATLVLTVLYGIGFAILMDQATAGPPAPVVEQSSGPDEPFSWMDEDG